MSESQAILALSMLTSQGSLEKVQQLIQNYSFSDKELVLGIILNLTPELQHPSNLLFIESVFKQQVSNVTNNRETVLNILSDDPYLLEVLETSPEVLTARLNALKSFVAVNSTQLGFRELSIDSWVEARVRKTFTVDPNIHFNDPLFELLANDPKFEAWTNGIVIPYEYLKTVSNESLTLTQFEELSEMERISILLKNSENSSLNKVDASLISMVQTTDPSSIIAYLVNHPPTNIKELQLLLDLIKAIYPTYQPKEQLIKQTSSSLYDYRGLSQQVLSSISDILHLFQHDSTDKFLNNLIKLSSAAKAIDYQDGPLKDLDDISRDPRAQQGLLQTVLEKINTQTSTDTIAQLLVLRQTIFTSIGLDEFNQLLVQRLLSLKLYFLISPENPQEDVIVDYFWTCFKRASNGSKHRGEMLNASHALKIFEVTPSPKIQSLRKLLDSVDSLSHYSLHFNTGKPPVPADLLTVGSVTEVIQRVLELNPEAYTEADKLLQISQGLSEGLELDEIDQYQLTVFCIESALVNDDFDFAFESSLNLLENTKDSQKLQQTWLSFFQVGKFVSPEWIDTEAPDEVIRNQLDLLAKVLNICPAKNTQVVIAQWSSLDMELSLRD